MSGGGVVCVAPCMTETLKMLKNPYLPGCESEQWTRCGGLQSSGDVLCSTHRRMVNHTAALSGRFDHKTLIRVHMSAFSHPSCRFPTTFFTDEIVGESVAGAKANIDTWNADPKATKDMIPLNDYNLIVSVMTSLFGTQP